MGNVPLGANDPILRMLTELNIMVIREGMPVRKKAHHQPTTKNKAFTQISVLLSSIFEYICNST